MSKFNSSRRAVGMWKSRALCGISKDCGKRGKRLFVFLSFHRAVISTAQVSRGSSWVIACYKTKMRLFNQIVATAGSALLLFSMSGCHVGAPDASVNEVARVISPDGLVDAVLTESNGGATTSFGYVVALASRDGSQTHQVADLYGATRGPQAYGVNLRWASADHLDIDFFSSKTPPTLYSPVTVGGKRITVTLHSGVIDTGAPPGGMLHNQTRK